MLPKPISAGLREVGQFSSLHDSFMIAQDCWFRSLGVQLMKRIRFHIASLLGVILIIGVGSAALRESSDLWDSGVFALTHGVLLISILLAVHRIETRRAFWIGFALFGWVYLGLSMVPSIESWRRSWRGSDPVRGLKWRGSVEWKTTNRVPVSVPGFRPDS
jgi:hypothetical protein